MKRSAAPLALVAAAAGVAAALIGPCDRASTTSPPADAPPRGVPTTADAASAPAVPPRPRRAAPAAESEQKSEAPDAPEDARRLCVRVVDARTKAPIAGADVAVSVTYVEGQRVSPSLRRRPVTAATTDADGEARIAGSKRREYRIEVRAPGRAKKTAEIMEIREDGAPVVVELAAGVAVRIEVADAPTGRPVAGATVRLRPNEDPRMEDVVVTDASGRAESCLPPTTTVLAATSAPEHVAAVDAVRTAAPDAEQPTLRVRLAQGATLRGVVRATDGAPVAGSTVHVRREGADGGLSASVTAEDGSYELSGLPLGAAFLAYADVPQFADDDRWCDSTATPFVVRADGAVVDLRLRSKGTLALTFVDDDGKVPSSMSLKTSGPSGEYSSSGGDGNVTTSLQPGRYVVRAWLDDSIPVEETFDVAEGATIKKRIVLSAGETVSGVVVDETGAPVGEAWIKDADPPADATTPTIAARTDDAGRFAARRVPRGARDLVVDPPWEFEDIVVRGVPVPSSDLRLVVTRRGTLSLRAVFDDDARPANSARIAFHAQRRGGPWTVDRVLADDGRIEIAWPSDVRGPIGIAVDGFLPVERTVTVPAGAGVDLGEIRMRRGASFTGVLVDAEGKPAEGRTVQAHGVWRGGSARSNDAGRFTLDGLPRGVVRIDVSGDPDVVFHVDAPSREAVVLSVPRGGRLVVALVDDAGAPVPGRPIVVLDEDGATAADEATDVSGEFERRLAPGKYVVLVDHGPHADVEIRAGETTFVKLR